LGFYVQKFCAASSLENSSSFLKKKGRIDLLRARRGQVPKIGGACANENNKQESSQVKQERSWGIKNQKIDQCCL